MESRTLNHSGGQRQIGKASAEPGGLSVESDSEGRTAQSRTSLEKANECEGEAVDDQRRTVSEHHIGEATVAAYVDGVLEAGERVRVEEHLGSCAECRLEVASVSRIVSTARTGGRSATRLFLPIAAAAGLALAWLGYNAMPGSDPEHRGAGVQTVSSPRALSPVGIVDSVPAVVWTSTPGAQRYRVRVFDADGTVVWETEVSDTSAVPPSTLALRRGVSYFWKVEARTGFDRWSASDLVEFAHRSGVP
jgi:hypothetical protein